MEFPKIETDVAEETIAFVGVNDDAVVVTVFCSEMNCMAADLIVVELIEMGFSDKANG